MEKEVDKQVLTTALEKFDKALAGEQQKFTSDELYALGAYFEETNDSSFGDLEGGLLDEA